MSAVNSSAMSQVGTQLAGTLRKTGGLEGLRDLPRSGRPPKISQEVMDGVLGKVDRFKTTPAELQQVIHKETGTKMHRTNVRKIMQKYGLSPKGSQKVHINRATKAAVKSWQYRLKKRISRLEKDGFVIASWRTRRSSYTT